MRLRHAITFLGFAVSLGAVLLHLWVGRGPGWLYASLLGSALGLAAWSVGALSPSARLTPDAPEPVALEPLEPVSLEPAPVREVAQAQEAPDVSGAMLEAMAALTRSNPLETALIDEEMTLVACHRGVGARLHLRSVQAGVSLYDAAPRTERGQALLWSLALCFKQGQSVFEAEWEDDVVRAELRRVRVGERYAALLALESNARRVSQVVTHNLVLQRSNADLRRSHEVLHHTNEQLRRTHQSQSQELANISHDLRTPLVSIRGYADMLVRGDLGPLQDAQRRGLETMHRNLDRLLGMIENLHEHNNLQQGVVKLRGEDLSMTQLVQDVVDMMQARAQESGSQLSFTLDEQTGPLPAHGDRVRLYQALSNLVGNAVKFTPGGEVRVELRLATEAEGHVLQGRLEEARVSTQQVQPLEAQLTRGSWLRLEVTDTGRGIPEEHLERIFNRYYSAHPGENQGSGLGLAITDQIVQLHGGIIEVTSMVGRGTTFVVWLPIGLTRPRVGSGGYSVTAPLRSLVPGGSVLVVDDDPDVREMTELALSQAGIQVELAANEQEMLEALARCSPAVVLLDYTLQGCANGHELLRRLKAEPGTCELPVLMVTGHSDPDLLQACRDAGAEDVLIKPFDIEELGEVVHGYVVRARAEATAARG